MKIPWLSGYSRPHHSFAEGRVFDFERSRSKENVWGLLPYIDANMVGIRSFFWNLKGQNYLVSPFT